MSATTRDTALALAHKAVYTVDLKYSLWSVAASVWQEYADKALTGILACLDEDGCGVLVTTAPQKEIRSGQVFLWREDGEDGAYHAEVTFRSSWDDCEDLADGGDVDFVEENVPRADDGEPGVSLDEEVMAPTFGGLMAAIDEVEYRLIERDRDAWIDFEALLASVAESRE